MEIQEILNNKLYDDDDIKILLNKKNPYKKKLSLITTNIKVYIPLIYQRSDISELLQIFCTVDDKKLTFSFKHPDKDRQIKSEYDYDIWTTTDIIDTIKMSIDGFIQTTIGSWDSRINRTRPSMIYNQQPSNKRTHLVGHSLEGSHSLEGNPDNHRIPNIIEQMIKGTENEENSMVMNQNTINNKLKSDEIMDIYQRLKAYDPIIFKEYMQLFDYVKDNPMDVLALWLAKS